MLAIDIHNRIGIITLNRPEKRNAFNPELISQLKNAVDDFNTDDEIRAILINAEGKAFSAGADLAYIQSLRSNSLEENVADSTALAEMFEAIYNSPKLTYTAVNGYALAGGCGLALITDFCLATENAQFGFTEARIGFIPALVTVYMMKKLQGKVVSQLMLEASIYDCDSAFELGLISAKFKSDNFDENVLQHIQTVISSTSGESIRLSKELIRSIDGLSHKAALEIAAKQNALARSSKDCIKGMDSFLNKTKISW